MKRELPIIAGGIGLGTAVDYLQSLGMVEIHRHERNLTTRLIDGLKKIHGVRVYATDSPFPSCGCLFPSPLKVCTRMKLPSSLTSRQISWCDPAIHCCQPLMEALGLPEGTVRASIGLYNTDHEIDLLIATLEEFAR